MKKRNRIVLLAAIILPLVMAAVGICFAVYNTAIDRNYRFEYNAVALDAVVSDQTNITISGQVQSGLTATKADLILISKDEGEELTLQSGGSEYFSLKSVDFEVQGERCKKWVFVDLELNQSEFVASFGVVVLKAVVSEAVFREQDDTPRIVRYNNIYVSSMDELRLANNHSLYNNIYELWSGYRSRIIYLLSDIQIDGDYTINVPCSIDLLASRIIVGDVSFRLAHSYSGAYFIEAISEESAVLMQGASLYGEIILQNPQRPMLLATPKALYRVSPSLESSILATSYSSDYTAMLLNDALEFAALSLPAKTHSDIILRTSFSTYGIQYSYYLIDREGALQEDERFDGRVSQRLRVEQTTMQWLRIYAATSTGEYAFVDRAIKIVGTSVESMLQSIMENIEQSYYVGSEQGALLSLDIDLLKIIQYEYQAGGFLHDINISIYESQLPKNDLQDLEGIDLESAALKNSAASRLIFSDGQWSRASRNITIGIDEQGKIIARSIFTLNGEDLIEEAAPSNELLYLVISKGIAQLSSQLFIELSAIGSSPILRSFELSISAKREVVYYIKSRLTPFTTNVSYLVLNLRNGAESGIYAGNEKLVSSLLGLIEIQQKLIYYIGEPAIESDIPKEVWEEMFFFDELNQSYTIATQSIDTSDIYLKYTLVFADGTSQDIYLAVIKSLADDGGENQEFESNNPFDELFMSYQTQWVNGGVFNVPSSSQSHYAYIEIVSVEGRQYNLLDRNDPMYKMVSIVVDTDTPPGDRYDDVLFTADSNDFEGGPFFSGVSGINTTYYKTLSFVTNRHYVPEYSVSVRVRCWYFNSSTPAIVLTEDYTIIVPGIFKCYDAQGDELSPPQDATASAFSDRNFYNLTMDLFQNNYVAEFINWQGEPERVLLSQSAYAAASLDYSGLSTLSDAINIEGIQRLKNVHTIRLDNTKISSVAAFSQMDDSVLTELSLKNCGLTDQALFAQGVSQSHLYNLKLKKVDLSQNAISQTLGLLPRTIITLNLSNQSLFSLWDISGLYNLSSIQTLDVSGNAIKRFEVLRELNTLKSAYIYDNFVDELDSELYGTDGRVNIPHYVFAIKQYDTKIYANSLSTSEPLIIDYDLATEGRYTLWEQDQKTLLDNKATISQLKKLSEGGSISQEQAEGAAMLNALAVPTKIFHKDAIWTLMNELFGFSLAFYNPYGGGTLGSVSKTELAFVSIDGQFIHLATASNLGGVCTCQPSCQDKEACPSNPLYQLDIDTVPQPNQSYTYIISAIDQWGNIIAFREFQVQIISI